MYAYVLYSSGVPSFMYVPHCRCPSTIVDGDGIPLPGLKQGVAAARLIKPWYGLVTRFSDVAHSKVWTRNLLWNDSNIMHLIEFRHWNHAGAMGPDGIYSIVIDKRSS